MRLRAVCTLLLALAVPAATAADTVIVLHGLARSASSMQSISAELEQAGYVVVNLDYPSTRGTVEQLAEQHLAPAVRAEIDRGATKLHFVTHSMGGILLRQYLSTARPPQLGRAVMLGPPNHGSELVARMGEVPGFDWLNGPAGLQLGPEPGSLPNRLGAVDYEVGIIAGTRTLNPAYSAMIPGPDDGKVSVASARVDGMADFIELPVTHTWMMSNAEVKTQTLHFLRVGRFRR